MDELNVSRDSNRSNQSIETLEEDQISSASDSEIEYNSLVTVKKKNRPKQAKKKVKLPPQKASEDEFFNEGQNLFVKTAQAKQQIQQSPKKSQLSNENVTDIDMSIEPIMTGEFQNTTPFIQKNNNLHQSYEPKTLAAPGDEQKNFDFMQQPAPPMMQSSQRKQNSMPTRQTQSFQSKCLHCGCEGLTRVEEINGQAVWILAIVLCALGCWFGCCAIPFFMPKLKNYHHYCKQCGSNIANKIAM